MESPGAVDRLAGGPILDRLPVVRLLGPSFNIAPVDGTSADAIAHSNIATKIDTTSALYVSVCRDTQSRLYASSVFFAWWTVSSLLSLLGRDAATSSG